MTCPETLPCELHIAEVSVPDQKGNLYLRRGAWGSDQARPLQDAQLEVLANH